MSLGYKHQAISECNLRRQWQIPRAGMSLAIDGW
jgi:hypothetical protein